VINEWLLREDTTTQTLRAMRAPTLAGKSKEARTRVPPTNGDLDILLSLALPSPEEIRVEWDITDAIDGKSCLKRVCQFYIYYYISL
jgi:hypothetical protein